MTVSFIILQPQHVRCIQRHHFNTRFHSLDGLKALGVVKEAELKVELSVIRKEMIADVMISKDGGQGNRVDGK